MSIGFSISDVNLPKKTPRFSAGKFIRLFRKAYSVHKELGDAGKKEGRRNRYGEMTLKADWEAEEVYIKGCADAKIPIIIRSEEHGEVSIGDTPKYTGILDGIDGTNAFRMGTGSYSTMFAIFEGLNPKYRDYLIAGILEYPAGRILIATKGEGAFVHEDDRVYPVVTSGKTMSDPNMRIFVDGAYEINKKIFKTKLQKFRNAYLGNVDNLGKPWGVSSMYYFKLVTG